MIGRQSVPNYSTQPRQYTAQVRVYSLYTNYIFKSMAIINLSDNIFNNYCFYGNPILIIFSNNFFV